MPTGRGVQPVSGVAGGRRRLAHGTLALVAFAATVMVWLLMAIDVGRSLAAAIAVGAR